MGIDPLTLGLAMGGASAASSLFSGLAANRQNRAHAEAQMVQAQNIRNQAEAQREQGELQVHAHDRQRAELTRQFREAQAKNAVSLGMGNVDASSGSALAVADGNASAFASDIGDNAYSRMNLAVANENAWKASMNQAAGLEAQAAVARKQSLFPTLLNATLTGAGSFMSGYGMAGGKLFRK